MDKNKNKSGDSIKRKYKEMQPEDQLPPFDSITAAAPLRKRHKKARNRSLAGSSEEEVALPGVRAY